MILEEADEEELQQQFKQLEQMFPDAFKSIKSKWQLSDEEIQAAVAEMNENLRKLYPDAKLTDEQLSQIKMMDSINRSIFRCTNCFYTEDPTPHPDWI
jgi:acetone carboxylase gamma subunit